MKKVLAVILTSAMVLSMAACGKPAADNAASSASKEASSASSASEASAASSASVIAEDADAASLVSDAFIDPVADWAQYDELIAQIKSATDMEERTALMHEAEDILMSNYAVVPLYYYNDLYMMKDYVEGVYANVFATKFFMYANLTNGSDTLRINLASEPQYLDPALNSSVDGACLAANSFSGLYTYNAEGKTAPACAEGYEVSEDGLDYTVTLKKDLKWSDGTPLTAADFEYSWKRAVSPDTAADYEYMFSGFAGYEDGDIQVKAVDDTTLEFSLSAPCAYIEDLMAFPTFFPVQQACVEAKATPDSPGAWCAEPGFVSNGAYVCTGWNHDTSMTYEKNPNYWDADNVKIEKLEFMLSADDTAIYSAYNAGDVDFIDTVPTDEVAGLIESENPEFYIVDQLGTYYIAFNVKSELFADKTPEQAACMREAFNILIDRDYIVENIGQTGQVPANSYIPLGMMDGNGGVFKENAEDGYFDVYATNDDHEATIEKAVALLKAAGYEFNDDNTLSDATPLSIEYLINEGTGHQSIAEAIQADLSEIGIDITIQSEDWNVFLEDRKQGNFDVAREGWIADFNDPINMLEMFTTTSGNNDPQYGR